MTTQNNDNMITPTNAARSLPAVSPDKLIPLFRNRTLNNCFLFLTRKEESNASSSTRAKAGRRSGADR